jgi:hypothetical protein
LGDDGLLKTMAGGPARQTLIDNQNYLKNYLSIVSALPKKDENVGSS